MLILWYAKFLGSEEELGKVNETINAVAGEVGGSVDGPYYPQDEDLLYLFKFDRFEKMTECGRTVLVKLEEAGIEGLRSSCYKIAVTKEEYWGK